MAQAKKGLGRGLSALIPTDMDFLAEVARGDFSILAPQNKADSVSRETAAPSPPEIPHATSQSERSQPVKSADAGAVIGHQAGSDAVLWLSPRQIEVNPYQPRRTFDASELSNLADSIREHGVLQPIIVRPAPSRQAQSGDSAPRSEALFQLIAGERRWRAAQAAELERVPVIVREVSDQQALELAIIENVQRHDISALDAATAYKRLAQEFGLSQEKIARRVGKSRPSIANTMRLLELPPEAQEAIQDGLLSEGHGRAILQVKSAGERRAVLRAILRERLSVRQAEDMAGRIAEQAQSDAAPTAPDSQRSEAGAAGTGNEARDWEERLQRALSCRVQVRRRRSGGQIVLVASDDDQMSRLLEALGGAS